MKKVSLFLAIIGILGASSCKTYTCYCDDGTMPTVKATSSVDAATKCAAKTSSGQPCGL
jgi:hypothetical protein